VESVQLVYHHVVIKIRQLFLRPAACLISILLKTGVAAKDCKAQTTHTWVAPLAVPTQYNAGYETSACLRSEPIWQCRVGAAGRDKHVNLANIISTCTGNKDIFFLNHIMTFIY
jgi:hypothetical protein